MNWKLYVDGPECRALDLCRGSMDEGNGSGYGAGYGNGDGMPRLGSGWGYGNGYGRGDGIGDGNSVSEWK